MGTVWEANRTEWGTEWEPNGSSQRWVVRVLYAGAMQLCWWNQWPSLVVLFNLQQSVHLIG